MNPELARIFVSWQERNDNATDAAIQDEHIRSSANDSNWQFQLPGQAYRLGHFLYRMGKDQYIGRASDCKSCMQAHRFVQKHLLCGYKLS